MSFLDAKPINRVSESLSFDMGLKRERSRREWAHNAKQSVNISHDTAFRAARAKLSSALDHKIAYNNMGELSNAPMVGGRLSVKV